MELKCKSCLRPPALCFASSKGKLEVVKFLVLEGKWYVDDYESYDDGEGNCHDFDWEVNQTPLTLACKNGHWGVGQFLVEQGADKDRINSIGKSPLYHAVIRNYLEMAQFLVEKGADLDKTDNQGNTPLLYAASWGQLEVVQLLFEQGADMDKADKEGNTPLYHAVRGGLLEVVQYLLEQGADRDKANNNGDTLLHLAAAYYQPSDNHLKTVKLLMVYGADLNARDSHGMLPINFARSEEIRQAILDEPRRRMDHGHKRSTEQDRHPIAAATSASAQKEEEEQGREEEEEEQPNKRPRLDDRAEAEGGITKVAEEDEDSEPSSHEDEDD